MQVMKHARRFILDLNKRQKSPKVQKGALSATFNSNLSRIQYYPRERPSSRRDTNPIFSLNILNFHRKPKKHEIKKLVRLNCFLCRSATTFNYCCVFLLYSVDTLQHVLFCCKAPGDMHACMSIELPRNWIMESISNKWRPINWLQVFDFASQPNKKGKLKYRIISLPPKYFKMYI